jgi:site-specific DNA-methyltransferase (adenine-specific)
MEFMRTVPDKHFALAIVDPPYGIGANWRKDPHSQFYNHHSSYENDSIPSREYFEELMRISDNQIIWGANYYTDYLPARQSWIVWNKLRDYPTQHLAEGELAWTSFNIPVRIATYMWNGACVCSPRSGIHPHEKPVDLYAWLLRNYAKPGDNIFDSHLGSGSSRIAAYKLGFDFVGCEIDKGYYESQEKRFQEECKDTVILPNGKQVKQLSIEI